MKLSQKSVIPRLTRNPMKNITYYQGIAGQARNDISLKRLLRQPFTIKNFSNTKRP